MKSYYNTTNLTGSQLERATRNANSQERLVLQYFQDHPNENIAVHEIHQEILSNVPLTSVRRAVTNLKDFNFIKKTDYMVMGIYGKPVHTFKLIPKDILDIYFNRN